MKLKRLFQVLVLGGGALVGAAACGGSDGTGANPPPGTTNNPPGNNNNNNPPNLTRVPTTHIFFPPGNGGGTQIFRDPVSTGNPVLTVPQVPIRGIVPRGNDRLSKRSPWQTDVGTSLEPLAQTFQTGWRGVRKINKLFQAVDWWAHKDSNLGPAD